MRIGIAFVLLTFVANGSSHAQVQWTRPVDVQAGQSGEAAVVVDRIDIQGRRITGSFDATDFAVTINISSGTRFRGFDASGAETIGFAGLSAVAEDDSIRVYGTGGSSGVIQAEEIRLIARSPGVALPTAIDGVVRSVNADENAFTIETADRRLWTIEGSIDTPVDYEGRVVTIADLAPGDRVSVGVETWDSMTPIPSRVAVIAGDDDANTLTTATGRVTALRPSGRILVLETGRGDLITVDLNAATLESGRRLSMESLAIGQDIEVTGRRMADGSFRASILRGSEGAEAGLEPLEIVDVRGVLAAIPDDEGWMRIDTRDGAREVLTDADQAVMLPGRRWAGLASLREGDTVRVRGVDVGGAIVAQVILVESE